MFDFLPEYWSLTTLYVACAAVGGAIVLLQLALSLFGFGADDVDVEAEVDLGGDSDLQFLSIRAIAGFLTMFGLVGWAGTVTGWSPPISALVAFGAGLTTFLAVAWLLSLQRKLDSSGTLDPKRAEGSTARVYLRIPAANVGRGKITVELQGRTAEFEAFTTGSELATGTQVRVVRMTSPGVFQVSALDD
ncbi:hypothetical protein [Engelhardtia mirabilis]|uniref:hypothetical protein n=1 Tax=Engelhardtia mirabilis TaxID=2528011 RepID=UPI0011A3FD8D